MFFFSSSFSLFFDFLTLFLILIYLTSLFDLRFQDAFVLNLFFFSSFLLFA